MYPPCWKCSEPVLYSTATSRVVLGLFIIIVVQRRPPTSRAAHAPAVRPLASDEMQHMYSARNQFKKAYAQ
jgi:hypothetical protein